MAMANEATTTGKNYAITNPSPSAAPIHFLNPPNIPPAAAVKIGDHKIILIWRDIVLDARGHSTQCKQNYHMVGRHIVNVIIKVLRYILLQHAMTRTYHLCMVQHGPLQYLEKEPDHNLHHYFPTSHPNGPPATQ